MILSVILIVSALVLVGLFVGLQVHKVIYRKKRSDEPPVIPGHVLFGNGVQFEENAVRFLLDTAKRFGDIFTLRFLHHHITVVMDIHAYQDFCRNEAFDFDPIQKQVNWNVFHFVIKNASTIIRESAKTVRGKQLLRTMGFFCKNVNEAINEHTKPATVDPSDATKLLEDNWQTDGLRVASANLMFSSIFYTVFGQLDRKSAFNPKDVHSLLTVFHRYFNYLWMGIPIQALPEANKTFKTMMSVSPHAVELIEKEDALPYIRSSVQVMLESGQTDEEIRKHNLVLLHVNYNTFRVSFWALYHLLIYADARAAVQQEVADFVASKINQGKLELTLDDLASLPILDSFVKETFRMCSGVFMIRGVTEDTKFATSNGNEYFIRKGDKVAIYPPALHHDPEMFPEPHKFVYNRFVNAVFYKNGREVRNPLLAFGSLCPGQTLATNQLKMFLVAWLSQIEAELLPGERTNYNKKCYGHEILPPENDVQIRYRRVANIEFSFAA